VLAGFAYLLSCDNGSAGSTAGCVSSLISDGANFRVEQLEFWQKIPNSEKQISDHCYCISSKKRN